MWRQIFMLGCIIFISFTMWITHSYISQFIDYNENLIRLLSAICRTIVNTNTEVPMEIPKMKRFTVDAPIVIFGILFAAALLCVVVYGIMEIIDSRRQRAEHARQQMHERMQRLTERRTQRISQENPYVIT